MGYVLSTYTRTFARVVNGADQLERLTQARRYREAAQALQAAKELQSFFKSYMAVERIAAVWKQVGELQATLRTLVMEDYEK